MPEEAVIDAPEAATDPREGAVPYKSPEFQDMVKHMESTRSGDVPPETNVEDTRPVDPPELKREPKAKAEKVVEQAKDSEAPKETEKEPFTSPRAADWKKLKADRDEWQKKATEHETAVKTHSERAAALEKEYTEFKTKTAIDPKEIEALKHEREEAQARLARIALQETPKFKAHFDSKFEAATARALDAVGKEKGEQIKAVLEAPKSAWRKGILNELVTGMENEVDKLNLIAAVNEYDQARDERNKELDNHKSNLRELKAVEQKRAQEEKERDVARRKALLDETLKQAEKFEAFKTGDDAEHNLTVAKSKKLVEDFVMGGDVPDSVVLMLPVLASEGERLQKVVPKMQAKIAELEEALKKYQGAAPQLEGQGDPAAEPTEPESFTQQVMKAWPGAAPQSR